LSSKEGTYHFAALVNKFWTRKQKNYSHFQVYNTYLQSLSNGVRHPWRNPKEMLWSRCRWWRTQEQLINFTIETAIVAFLSEPVKGKPPYGGGYVMPQVRNLRTAHKTAAIFSI